MKARKGLYAGRQHQARASAGPKKEPLPWKALEQQVVRMQKQIGQACLRGDREVVHRLQQQLLEAEAARLLAVRRVAEENQGKHTAGVDGVKSLTLEERLAMAAAIHPAHWQQQLPEPVRRVWIPKQGTDERRPLAILPMIDRCKQALVKLALEPEWEVRFEPHSYGYRPGRGVHDAIAALAVAVERRPAFVFDADIESAFDGVRHDVLLDKLQTYPALRRTIEAWLKAGVIESGVYTPSKMGIAQGGVLSPLLMNVALHGMETVVAERAGQKQRGERPLLVRYGDDFVILHPDLAVLQQAARLVRQWLATLGLRLNQQKTHIAHTLTAYQGQVGFDFLGFCIRQETETKNKQDSWSGGKGASSSQGRWPVKQEQKAAVKTTVSPSQEASQRHLTTIEQRLRQLQNASQTRVIEELNPLITGWASYYNGMVAAATMSYYDALLRQQLLGWASNRHPGKTPD